MNNKLPIFIFVLVSFIYTPVVLAKEKPPIFYLTEFSTDPEYGKVEHKPINVGGMKETGGHGGQRWFFHMLSGSNGEALDIQREGACCWFDTPNGYRGKGALDKYSVYIGEQKEPIVLYLNSYEFEKPLIPVGFGTKVDESKVPFTESDEADANPI